MTPERATQIENRQSEQWVLLRELREGQARLVASVDAVAKTSAETSKAVADQGEAIKGIDTMLRGDGTTANVGLVAQVRQATTNQGGWNKFGWLITTALVTAVVTGIVAFAMGGG